jgi:hypothetical protein
MSRIKPFNSIYNKSNIQKEKKREKGLVTRLSVPPYDPQVYRMLT